MVHNGTKTALGILILVIGCFITLISLFVSVMCISDGCGFENSLIIGFLILGFLVIMGGIYTIARSKN